MKTEAFRLAILYFNEFLQSYLILSKPNTFMDKIYNRFITDFNSMGIISCYIPRQKRKCNKMERFELPSDLWNLHIVPGNQKVNVEQRDSSCCVQKIVRRGRLPSLVWESSLLANSLLLFLEPTVSNNLCYFDGIPRIATAAYGSFFTFWTVLGNLKTIYFILE